MNYSELFAAIDALEEEYIRFWEDICMLESPTAYKAGVDAVAEFCCKKAESLGWETEIHYEEVSGNAVCITMNPTAAKAAVCFSGHMDTVQAVGSCGTPAVHKDDTYIYGPGVKDCKGGIVASFLAMEALQRCGFTARPIKLILQSDEENSAATSNQNTIRFMAEKAQGCEVFLNTEGYNAHKAVLWRKGIGKYRFSITGESSHASRCAREGASAIREAACKILQIEENKDEDGITMSCGTITGGTVVNVIPEKCEFSVDVRFATTQQMDEADAFLQRLADTNFVTGCTTQLTCLSRRPPMPKEERNFAMLDRINAIFEEAGLPVMKASGTLGGSDAANLTVAGITCVDSMGVTGDRTHSIRERALLCSLKECARRLGAAALGL